MLKFWCLFGIVSGLKLLFIPAYRSTDFEVHRNWLAITRSLPLKRWYYEETSEWTLDYPPFFAYFEYILGFFAQFFDPKMLEIKNLNYASEKTILFQRLSVIVTDFVYALGALSCLRALKVTDKKRQLILSVVLLFNVGLLMVDHIHFQYNGILFGILLLSIGATIEEKYLKSAIYFTILLNMKHIFIYFAPVYFIFLLKNYCLNSKTILINFVKLGSIVVGITLLSFGPFYDHIPQVLSRLFPFKRGLSHAYWAPNFWALYNFVDKVLAILLKVKSSGKSTSSGLVQTFDHDVLPTVSPLVTLVLTVIFIIPFLIKLWFLLGDKNRRAEAFVKSITLCGLTAFMFGWHVHEKAILMVLIPLSTISISGPIVAQETLFLSTVGIFSLFPLLFPTELIVTKIALLLSYSIFQFYAFSSVHRMKFSVLERIYLFNLATLLLYSEIVHFRVKFLADNFQFLPLMLTSVYCAIGIVYFWTTFYYKFMTIGSSKIVTVNKKQKKK